MIRFLATLLISIFITQIRPATRSCQPEQIHIALSDAFTSHPTSASTIKVIFHTQSECNSAYITLKTPSGLQKVTASQINYFTESYKKGWYETYVHVFDFNNLAFSQIYEYTCYGTENTQTEFDGPFEFYVPNPKSDGSETNVVMFGDMDVSSEGMTTINRLMRLAAANFTKISAFIHVGDLAYNLSTRSGAVGDNYMRTIQQFTANMPYMVTAGNHEEFNNFSNFNMRFHMPLHKETQNHYHSYNIGNMHFTSFNMDLVLWYPELKQAMLDWLAKDLDEANRNRKERPWIIAYTHRPIYCSHNDQDCNTNSKRFKEFEHVLNKYNVDLVVAGHVHIYERMLPIRKNNIADFHYVPGDITFNSIVNPKGPVHVVQGMAGHRGDYAEAKDAYDGKQFTVMVDKAYSYMAVRSTNSTHLHVENFRSDSGTVNDEFYIIKSGEARFTKLPRYKMPPSLKTNNYLRNSKQLNKFFKKYYIMN